MPAGDAEVAAAVAYGPALPRATADRVDEVTGYQVHVVYVLPSDGADRVLDTSGALTNTVASFQTWLSGETGDRPLRFDTYQGSVDISFLRLSRTEADIESEDAYVRNAIEDETRAAGFNAPNKIYAVYYDGTSKWSCGGGAWPPDLVGNVGALYLDGLPDQQYRCSGNQFAAAGGAPTYWEYAMLHEIMHTLGFVAPCAPTHTLRGHTSENANDLMWSGSGNWFPNGYANAVLDFGNNDYYNHANAGCPDFSDSPFLSGNNAPRCAGRTPTVGIGLGQFPTRGPDVIVGTYGNDNINGRGGNDTICGGGGDDRLRGGGGDDRLVGGSGTDRCTGGAGNDQISCERVTQ